MQRIIFPLEERLISRPFFGLNVLVSKIDPSTKDKDWLVFVSSCRSELIDLIKKGTISKNPLIVCISNSFVKMKLRKKVNDKRLFPAFYRTKKTQLSKRQIKAGNAASIRFHYEIFINVTLKQFEAGICQK